MAEPAQGLYTCIPSEKNLQTGIWTSTDEMLVVEAASFPDAIRKFEAWKSRYNLPYTFPHIQYHIPTEDAYAVDITKPEDPDER